MSPLPPPWGQRPLISRRRLIYYAIVMVIGMAAMVAWYSSTPGHCSTADAVATLNASQIRSYRSRYEETGKQVFLDKLTEAKDSFASVCESIREQCRDSRAIQPDNPCFREDAD